VPQGCSPQAADVHGDGHSEQLARLAEIAPPDVAEGARYAAVGDGYGDSPERGAA
jgi:hypothetical protein